MDNSMMKESELQDFVSLKSISFTSFDGESTRRQRYPEKTPSIQEYEKYDRQVFPRHQMGFVKKPECTTLPSEIPEAEKKEMPRGPRWKPKEEMSYAQKLAKSYFVERRIQDLFQYMIGHLLASTPDDPLDFLKDLMDRCLMFRSRVTKCPPLLFDSPHTESVFLAFDPLKSGFITKNQYHKAMETIGITEYEKEPCTFKGLVPKKVWMENSRIALTENFLDMISPPPEGEPLSETTEESMRPIEEIVVQEIPEEPEESPFEDQSSLTTEVEKETKKPEIEDDSIVIMEENATAASEVGSFSEESNYTEDFSNYSEDSIGDHYHEESNIVKRKKEFTWSDMEMKAKTNITQLKEKKLTNVRKEVLQESIVELPQTRKKPLLFSSFTKSNPYFKNYEDEFEFMNRYNQVTELLKEPPEDRSSEEESVTEEEG